ncbi:MAG: zinc-dependent metalloprotease [Planctomycetota bacterium]
MNRSVRPRSSLFSLIVLALVATTQLFVSTRASAQEFPPIAQATKGYTPVTNEDGSFLTLYINRKKHRVLAAIPSSMQRRPFLLATSITGGSYLGWQWNDKYVYLERHDRRLLLVEPQIQRKGGKGAVADVVKRTYRDTILTTVPIMAVSGGTVLIDLSSLFASRASLFVGSLASGTDSSLAKIVKAKVFPRNIELEFDLPRVGGGGGFSSLFGGGGGSSGGVAIHYSVPELPRTGYQPRVADDRIGYFLTAHKDFSIGPNAKSQFVRYINRWNLQKADPSLKLSPPKKPIVFYIEKTVPIRFRQAVREGILEWNKAFRKIGILQAIEVRQQTEEEFADLDPEDVNYNFFRWIASESAFAMGPSRVHPETGEILDADIIFDEAMIRTWFEEYGQLIQAGPAKEFHPSLQRYLKEHPERHPMRRWLKREGAQHAHVEGEAKDSDRVDRANHHLCDYGTGKRHQVSFGLTVLRTLLAAGDEEEKAEDKKPEEKDEDKKKGKGKGKGKNEDKEETKDNDKDEKSEKKDDQKKDEDKPEKKPAKKKVPDAEFLAQVLKEVVMHEVGHTLGLRHNFKASSWLALEEINKKDAPVAFSGSVMDYNPTNITGNGKPQGQWATGSLGPYDYWAIEYGYTFKNGDLRKIASRASEKGLAYATDEDTTDSDPYVYRFDMGADPLAYARERMELVDETLRKLLNQVEKGESYEHLRHAFDMLVYDYAKSSWRAAKFLGGHHIRRVHKGDPGEKLPVEPVNAKKQREAVDLVCEKVFAKGALNFSPELINRLAAGRWSHWGASSGAYAEYPIHDRIAQIQLWSLFDFVNPRILTLVADTELRVKKDADVVTIPEIFSKLRNSIWSEVHKVDRKTYTNRRPFIDSIRRNLQYECVSELINLALEGENGLAPQSARTQAAFQLSKLRSKIKGTLALEKEHDEFSLDDYSEAHLVESARRIEKALEASYSRDGGGGGGGLLFFRPGPNSDPQPKP